jgi:hypothetical protein
MNGEEKENDEEKNAGHSVGAAILHSLFSPFSSLLLLAGITQWDYKRTGSEPPTPTTGSLQPL